LRGAVAQELSDIAKVRLYQPLRPTIPKLDVGLDNQFLAKPQFMNWAQGKRATEWPHFPR
jgi:hypothetical protein